MAGSTRSYEMARHLVDSGHGVHMLTSDRNATRQRNSRWYETYEAGIRVHWLPIPYGNRLSYGDRIKAFLKFAIKAATKAASLGGDVVFATSTPLTIALPGIYAAKRNRIPMVFEVRDLWPELPIAVGAIRNPELIWAARQLEKLAYHFSSRVVALSPGMKEGIVAKGYPAKNVTIIPNICNQDLFGVPPEYGHKFRSQHSWLGNRHLVVYMGTLGTINGVGYLARLAKAVRNIDPEIRFLIIGTGKEEQKVLKTAVELGVFEQNFFMMGEVARKEIPIFLSAADIATSTVIDMKELWANSANKFFDALASGTPVGINYRGWQADLLRKTGSGIVLDVNDIQAAAEALVRVIHDRQWLERSSAAAQKLARQEFSGDGLAKKFEQVLVEAVQKR